MLRHKYLIAVALVLLTAGLVAAVLYIQSRPTYLKIAVGPRTGEDLRLAQTLSQHLSRERSKIRLRVVRKETGAEGAEALDKGEVDLAVVRRDLGMPKNGQVIAIHRRNVAVLVVPPHRRRLSAAAKRKGKGKSQGRSQECRQTDREDRGSRGQDRRHRRPHAGQREFAQHHPRAIWRRRPTR